MTLLRYAALAVPIALAGCGGLSTVDASKIGAVTTAVDPHLERDVTVATDLCRRSAPVRGLASAVPETRTTLVGVDAVCGPLLAGVVPTTFDANTVPWLEKNLSDLLSRLPR